MFKLPRFWLPLAAVLCAISLAPSSRAQFVEKAASAGVDLNFPTSVSGHAEPGLDPYSVGGAAAACDLDGDGWTDLIVARTGQPCSVFMNNGNGTFREEGVARGLASVSDIGGIGAGDIDNDGDTDLLMAPVAGERYFLFINDGSGRFTEAAAARGADLPVSGERHKGQSVSFVDYNRDGYLDAYIAEWNVLTGSENARHSVLLRNRGASAPGHFENVTAAAGLTQPPLSTMIANYASAWADYDGNGYPDMFLAGDFGTSQLWWNNGDGTFTEGTTSSNIRSGIDAMGITVFDYDADGRLDIFTTAIELTNNSSFTERGFRSTNRLYRNLGNRQFQDAGVSAGVSLTGWGWGTGYLDANNDGLPDLVATNGYVAPGEGFASAKVDPSKFFLNAGGGVFTDETTRYGITDAGLGRGLVVFDYDNDGREDVFIVQSEGHRLLYRNESPASAHWLALKLTGSSSNRDGYGAEVTITAGGRTQTALYNPTNSYIGQREPRLHFGLGSATTISRLTVKWPSGATQELTNVAADQLLNVSESGGTSGSTAAPVITGQPNDTAVAKDGKLTLSVTASGAGNVYNWFRDGTRLTGATNATFTLDRTEPIDAGSYTVTVTNVNGSVTSRGAAVTVTADLSAKSVARWWNEALLDGIRKDTPNPPVHARNLYHLSTVLWDTFWAYETDGWVRQKEMFTKETVTLPTGETDRVAAQREAMSYAAYTFIKTRFARSPGVAATTAGIRWLMQQYGFNPDLTDSAGSSPAATGIRIAQRILDLNRDDGANEAGNYADASGFTPANPALLTQTYGVGTNVNPDFWQPLNLANTITQNGIVLGNVTQSFVGSNAINTRTFALQRATNRFLMNDPGPPPLFSSSGQRAEYARQAQEVITYSSHLTVDDGVTLDISPGKLLNNPLGTNDGKGHATNPSTNQPYASNVVLRGDYARVLAEFWADGPQSETPPGHWNVLFNQISDHSAQTFRYRGGNIVLRRIEWDVAGYLALNGALHDAACAAWSLKWEYNSARPLTMIRYLATLGQSSDPGQPGYNASGLPLVPGVIEVVTTASSAPGERHAHLANHLGKIAVKSWLGTPPSPAQTSGTGWILGGYWMPYQRETFVTPAFPGYISGHSTFSRAGAEALTSFTGSEYFPGGLASYTVAQGSLGFEYGPSKDVTLQWATYYDAADQAGLSRLFGGIHIAVDDFIGRRTGSKVGQDAFAKFTTLYTPPTTSAPSPTPAPAPAPAPTPAPSTGGGGGGGGGAPSAWFLLVFVGASVLRRFIRRG